MHVASEEVSTAPVAQSISSITVTEVQEMAVDTPMNPSSVSSAGRAADGFPAHGVTPTFHQASAPPVVNLPYIQSPLSNDDKHASPAGGSVPPTANAGTTFETREYTIASFERGDFIYPQKSTTEDGEITNPTSPSSEVPELGELGDLTPMAAARTLDDGAQEVLAVSEAQREMWEEAVPEVDNALATEKPNAPLRLEDQYFHRGGKILGATRGDESGTPTTLEFEISGDQMELLKRWAERYDTPR